MKAALAVSLLAGAALAEEAPVIRAPSGLDVALQDVVWEPESGVVRLRFVAEALGGPEPMAFSAVADDFLWLCQTYGVQALERNGLDAAQVVISIADRAVPLGTINPEAVQFFEGYSIDASGACVWEPY